VILRPYSRSCRTASIRSGIAGGLAGELDGLWPLGIRPQLLQISGAPIRGERLVSGISGAISRLERKGHFGPFALVLGDELFTVAQTPEPGSLVLPQDRIIPFLGGGSLVRSSTLPGNGGVAVALGGAPVELVIAKDVSLPFLQGVRPFIDVSVIEERRIG
jgi:uncharacterized linocin/CFP29 family protein